MAKGKQRSLIKRPATTNAGAMKQILEAGKADTVVLGKIQKHLLAREDGERDMTMLHPSEMAKADWCPRQSFYRLSPEHPDPPPDDHGYVLLNIFDEGHFVHGKYQQRLWDLGLLRGYFRCEKCGHRWAATSPVSCNSCGAPKGCLTYKEVPLRSDEYMITGHADGDIALGEDDDPLLEVKTIGEGTVRVEHPQLLWDYSTTTVDGKAVVDLAGLWGAVKRPFPSHLRQAMLYLAITGRKRMVFIYECKWNQQTKEFVVKFRKDIAAPLLDAALDVKYGLEKNRPPHRPGWATPEAEACKKCPYTTTCYPENEDGDQERGPGAGDRSRGEAQGGPDREDRAPGEAPVQGQRGGGAGRSAEGSAHPVRVVRRRPDAVVRRPDPVD